MSVSKKRAVVIEPNRDKRLQLAAVLKGEQLQIAMMDGEGDLFSDPQTLTADVIVLRAEMDRQSGYSLCNRLRSNERSAHAKIVIVATNPADPRLQSHRASAQAADAYIVHPLGLRDLRIQAYALLDLDGGTLSDEDIQAVEEDPMARLDELFGDDGAGVRASREADAEAESQIQQASGQHHDYTEDELEGAFGALSGKKAVAAPVEELDAIEDAEMLDDADIMEVPLVKSAPSPLSQLNQDDLDFVARAFDGVKDAHKTPPLPPGVKSAKDLRGPDAKIYQLREKLRERELEIAKLQDIWQQHEAEYAESAQRTAEMEIEVKSAQMQAEEAKRKLKEREDDNARQNRGSSATIDRLLEEKVLLEKDLIEVVASKEKNVAELRRMLSARERDITQMNGQIEQLKREHEEAKEEASATLQREMARASATLDGERQRNTEATIALEAQHQERVMQLESELAQRMEAAAQKFESNEREWTDKYDRAEAARAALEIDLRDRQGEVRGLQIDLASVKNDLEAKAQREVELATQLGELRERLDNTEAQANETRKALTADLQTLQAERDGIQQRLGQRLDEREQQIAQKDQTLGELTRELQAAREERDTLTQRLGDRLKERELSIDTLEKTLADLRIEKAQVEERLNVLNEERARIERSLAMDDVAPTLPSPAETPPIVPGDDPEESIPIADSDESVLFGNARNKAG